MWRKDLQRTLWVPGLSVMYAAATWLVTATGWTFRDFRTTDLLDVLYHGGLVLILPLLAFLAGLTLFQQEQWALVWTFPLGQGRVLAGKLLAGWIQILLGGALMACLFRLFFQPPTSGILGVLMVLGLALGAFLLGALAGIGAPSVGAAVLLLLGALIFVAVIGRWSGLVWSLAMSWYELGQGVAIFLAVVFILGTTGALAAMYRAHRMFRPWRNAILAFGLLAGLPLAILALNAALLRYANGISNLEDIRPYRLRIVSERTLLVEGATRKLGWLDSLAARIGASRRWRGVDLGVLYHPGSRRVIQIHRQGWIEQVVPSDDGKFLLLLVGEIGGWDPNSLAVRVLTSDGKPVWRFSYGSAFRDRLLRPFWRPGSHEVLLATGSTLLQVNLDSGRRTTLPLPSELPPFRLSKDFEYHSAVYLEDGTLAYLRHYGPRGYQVFACPPGGRSWELAEERRAQPGEAAIPAYGFWPTSAMFTYAGEWRILHAEEGRVWTVALPASAGSLVARLPDGLLLQRDGALWLRRWDARGDEKIRDFPCESCEGYSYRERVFLMTRGTREADSKYRCRIFVMGFPSRELHEIPSPMERCLGGSLHDCHGAVGLISCWTEHDNWTGLIDLRTGKLQKLSLQLEWD